MQRPKVKGSMSPFKGKQRTFSQSGKAAEEKLGREAPIIMYFEMGLFLGMLGSHQMVLSIKLTL